MNECSLVHSTNPNKQLKGLTSPWLLGTTLVLVCVSLLVLSDSMPINMDLFSVQGLQELVNHVGPWGPVIYMSLLIISVVASQIPGAPLAIAAGSIWGPMMAGLYTLAGGFLGAVFAYFLGKYLGQPFFKILTGKTITLSPQRNTKYLGWFIFLSRLVPILSFDLVSYGAGMTGLSLPIYASATFIGMIPSTLMLTYTGGSLDLDSQHLFGATSLLVLLFLVLPLLVYRVAGSGWKEMMGIQAD